MPATRKEAPALRQLFETVRVRSLQLAAPLSVEDQNVQSMPEASPVKWHLAHSTWFLETFVLTPLVKGYKVFHPQFSALFNSNYNAVGEQLPRARRGLLSRPSLDEVHAYRRHVDMALLNAWEDLDADAQRAIELGVHHEEQHQEAMLTDVKHALSLNPLGPTYLATREDPSDHRSPHLHWGTFEEAVHVVGHDGGTFAFDNEGPRHRVLTGPFKLASRLVTNLEYREFMADGGYVRPELWLSDGWELARANGWTAPLYWTHDDGSWRVMTLQGWRDLNLEEPVLHVSYYEADAFARWADARLPTEFEWERAAQTVGEDGNFLDSGALHPAIARAGALVQVFGDAWEWTQSAYAPYPGYRAEEGALGEYNGKYMANQQVLKGGSCVTPPRHVRPSYRGYHPPASRWQFTGIRLCLDVKQVR